MLVSNTLSDQGPEALRFNELYATTAGQLDMNRIGSVGFLALQGYTKEMEKLLPRVPVLTMRLTDLELGLLHLSVLGFREMLKQRGLASTKTFLVRVAAMAHS